MSATSEFTQTPFAGLQARLLAEASASITVLTPNLRLARELQRSLDQAAYQAGHRVWAAPDVLPFNRWLERLYEAALYSGTISLPRLLTPAQAQLLWEEVIRAWDGDSALLSISETAAQASAAWTTAHAWQLWPQITLDTCNDDGRAFRAWANAYRQNCARSDWMDQAQLVDRVRALFETKQLRCADALVLYGFDIVTPQQRALLMTLQSLGIQVEQSAVQSAASRCVRMAAVDPQDELQRAAHWARVRLAEGLAAGRLPRIGIVVPALQTQRADVYRHFMRVLEPAALTQAHAAPTLPFNISLGTPLTEQPLIHAALGFLSLAGERLSFEQVSALLRSPFIAGARSEADARAQLDWSLRRHAEPQLSLDELATLLQRADLPAAPWLQRLIAAYARFRRERLKGAQLPSAWVQVFNEVLTALGFPGEEALNSAQFQAWQKWQALLAEVGGLDGVTQAHSLGTALAQVHRFARDTLFQPQAQDEPIQILGVLESASVGFDHLWVMGMHAQAWPLSARPNPLLPMAAQRAAGIPEGSAEASLALDRRITAGWCGAATEVVFSHPQRDADQDLSVSPLIAHLPLVPLPVVEDIDWIKQIFSSRQTESVHDTMGVPLPVHPQSGLCPTPGGSGAIQDQAACPFRAYVRYRLQARALLEPHAGLDALERGTLVHAVLAYFWRHVRTSEALHQLSDEQRQAQLQEAATQALQRIVTQRPRALPENFAAIEHARLVRLANQWIQKVEWSRTPFEVTDIEATRSVQCGPLQLEVRLDRVDQTAQGSRVVIDYKTGNPERSAWFGARPKEPQLPLYLLTTEPDAQAITYAQLNASAQRWIGVAQHTGVMDAGALVLPDARLPNAAHSWAEQQEVWRVDLERLAQDVARGEARVDPMPGACQWCDFKAVCRVDLQALKEMTDETNATLAENE